MSKWESGTWTVAALLAACTVARGHSRCTSLNRREEALDLHLDGRRILGDAGEVGHDADELDLGDAPDGLEEASTDSGKRPWRFMPLSILRCTRARTPEPAEGRDLGHVVAHHGEVDASAGHLLVLVQAVERPHDQDHAREAGVAQGDGFLGGSHRHAVGAGRHHRSGDGEGAVAVAVGLDGHEHAGARPEKGGEVGDVAAYRCQIYEYAAARRRLHRRKRLTHGPG